MNKQEFMDILRTRLSNVNPIWRDEVLADLEEHFQEAQTAGISDEEIISHLGDPMELAQQFYEEAALSNQILTDTTAHTAKSGILGRRSAEKGARIIRNAEEEADAATTSEASQVADEPTSSAKEESSDAFSSDAASSDEEAPKHRSQRTSRPHGQFTFTMDLGKEISRTIQDAIDSVNLSKTMQDVYDSISSVFQSMDGSSRNRTFTFGLGKKPKRSSQDLIFTIAEPIEKIYAQVQGADIMLDACSDLETTIRYDDSLSDLQIQCENGTLSIEQSPEHAYQRGHSAAIRISLPAEFCPSFEMDSKLGDIEIKYPHADQVNIKSRTGNIQFLVSQCNGSLSLSSLEEILVRTQYVQGDVYLHSVNGDISASLEDIAGNLEIKDVSGDITLRLGSANGSVKVNCASGDIELKANQCNDDVVLYTVNGDMELHIDSILGNTSFRLTNGDLQADINQCENLLAKAISGDLELNLTDPLGDLELSTTNGDIQLTLPSPARFALDVNSRSGDVESNLDDFENFTAGPQLLKISSISGDIRMDFNDMP